MTEHRADMLYELADLIHAVARQLGAPADLRPGPCTPVEISVMRFVGKHPGTSARLAADAARLPSSNFSRVLKGLVAKGLLRRETDERDARGVRLFPTRLAEANTALMRDAWSRALADTTVNLETLTMINATLARIDAKLAARSPVSMRSTDP